jgi:methionyl-tRNA synthetase
MPQTAPSASLEDGSMRLYSEAEITTLIEEITDVATEAIEKAAGEAAQAATLAVIDREAKAIAEAGRWQTKYNASQKNGVIAASITGALCFAGGFILGRK